MTDTTQYAWRSDLKCIETDSDMVFREIYPNGNETVFTITEKKPFTRYAFHMENKRLEGAQQKAGGDYKGNQAAGGRRRSGGNAFGAECKLLWQKSGDAHDLCRAASRD